MARVLLVLRRLSIPGFPGVLLGGVRAWVATAFVQTPCSCRFLMLVVLLLFVVPNRVRVHHAAYEQDRACGRVPDKEDEGPVDRHRNGLFACP